MHSSSKSTKRSKNSNLPKELPHSIDPNLNLEKIKAECRKLVKSRARISAGVAMIPVPFLDVAVDAGLLSMILPEITARFGLIDNPKDVSKLGSKDERVTDIKNNIFKFAGIVATRGIAKQVVQGFGGRILAKQVTKFIPFGGQIVAGTLGYVIFKKVAGDHIDECYELVQRIRAEADI